MTSNEPENRWRFDRHVNIAHIMTTVAIVVAIFRWASVVEQRIVQLEERLVSQQALSRAVQDATTSQLIIVREEFSTVRREIVRTNEKLDRLLENQLRVYNNNGNSGR